jgi:hypothetical protein
MKKNSATLHLSLSSVLAAGLLLSASATATHIAAPDSYGKATNTNATWQQLGSSSLLDDGVSWSVDGGKTFGHQAIGVGKETIFNFEIVKDEWGVHQWDALKVWVDMNRDGSFQGDRVLQDQWNFEQEHITALGVTSTQYHNGFNGQFNQACYDNNRLHYTDLESATDINGNSLHYANASKTFTTKLTFNTIGDYWLRARTVCNFDIGSMSNFTYKGTLFQGETEDWKLRVVTAVPEPSSIGLLLMGLAMVGGMAFNRKKRS